MDPAKFLADWAPVLTLLVGAAGSYLGLRIQNRNAGASELSANAGVQKVVADLVNARTTEWDKILGNLTADNTILRSQVAQAQAELATANLKIQGLQLALDQSNIKFTSQNEECQRLTSALVERFEELVGGAMPSTHS